MLGLVTSPNAFRVLQYLEKVLIAPFFAISVATGFKARKLAKALRHLRRADRAFPVQLQGVEFWAVDSTGFDIEKQETLAWFVARVIEAGGKYENGKVIFPSGEEYEINIQKGKIIFGRYYCLLSDLKESKLKNCIRTKI